MAQIKHVTDGTVYTVATNPQWIGGIWECGDQRFTDPSGTAYQVVSANYTPSFVSIPVFKLLFTPQEEVGIYGRVNSDPQIARFVALVDDPKTTQLDLNLPAVQERIKYLGSVAAATPADGLPLSATRISEVLAGTLQ